MNKKESLVGRRFEKLVVVSLLKDSGPEHYICRCDCGNTLEATRNNLVTAHTKSCGCLRNRITNLVGNKYGRLLVTDFVEIVNGYSKWACECDCGKSIIVRGTNLTNGNTQSCGCLSIDNHTTHGKSHSLTYKVWQGMHQRCYNEKEASYKYYGARGIKVCKRWHTFENFFSDVGEKPTGMFMDRVNNDGDYKPSNFRWATVTESNRNKRQSQPTDFYVFNGKRQSLKEWAEELRVPYMTLYYRLKRGWSYERTFNSKIQGK
jgi:hypothetical protein